MPAAADFVDGDDLGAATDSTQTKPSESPPRVAEYGAVSVDEGEALLAVLERKPLGYRVVRQAGSHRRMEASGWPPLTFAFHDNATIPVGLVRKILVRNVGLAEEEARKLL